MAPLNPYLAYKRDTSRLMYWIVRESNAIIASSSTLPDDVPKTPNTNGQVTVSSLVTLSKLIGKHIGAVPPTILGLFDAVIQARTAAYETFQQLVANKPDPDIERSNASHRHFLNALSEAFEALGGPAWAEKEKSKPADPTADNQADLEQVLFVNTFAALNLDEGATLDEEDDGVNDDESNLESQQNQARQRPRPKKSTGKGKKRKSGKSIKKKGKQQQPTAKTPSLDEVPVESYRIIQDEEGIITDYLMAVYALVQEWAELRVYLQEVWREVAYEGLNSAVAGAVSNIAIKMIERSSSAMFVYFPGHDSFETVMNTITRGDPEKAQGIFIMALHEISLDQTRHRKFREVDVDVKEQFLMYAYQDLVDFVTDFQKNRNGKPTKRMLQQIGNWDPNFDLRHASKAERLKWRRCYTINWLYDLVNLFSGIVAQRNTMRGESHKLESADWSPSGPSNNRRRLFGLNEFAGVITHLVMQKPGVDIREKILPHHVFQLQCIVDSLAISRGWSINSFRGHVVEAPPPGFRPRRDIDLFLDRDNKRAGSGFLQGVDILMWFFAKDGELHGDPLRHNTECRLLKSLEFDFVNWLGESRYMDGLTDMPPSRFSATNSNGLWEYSPFLCGVGLAEGLVEAYRYSFIILDRLPEPIMLVHLHNMLVQKGYIAAPVGLYGAFQKLFPEAFFVNGKIPTSNFGAAIKVRTAQSSSRRSRARGTLDDGKAMGTNRFSKTRSYLMSCEEAGWVPDRIPDVDIPMLSHMCFHRIRQTEHIVDLVTGRKRLKDTDLVDLVRAKGISDEYMIEITMNLPKKQEMSSRSLLSLLKLDISSDICGMIPLSSLNYVWVMAQFMGLFEKFEESLKKIRNPVYVRAYETSPMWRTQKRVGLAYLALHVQEEECLRVMAREFQNPRVEFVNHIYWDGLEDVDAVGVRTNEPRSEREEALQGQCAIM
ncbi:hypothetical protein F4820DRAFT_309220 [Hypoxylon rubiginosum]|uniref:Uncharacterized protein n=1 Tax=Hypoxylon rubiginosum TaxID=110542 RepID=A0ACB9Z0H6_9PEZI|nr:hypothetical protein F4820DRAFT_309220 [Hypoxylon rubiginosum]